MTLALCALNLCIVFILFLGMSRSWALTPFLALFEVLWAAVASLAALNSLLFNDIFFLFIGVVALFFSAVELVLGIATLFVIFHQQKASLL